jgi:hypothetical protein
MRLENNTILARETIGWRTINAGKQNVLTNQELNIVRRKIFLYYV